MVLGHTRCSRSKKQDTDGDFSTRADARLPCVRRSSKLQVARKRPSKLGCQLEVSRLRRAGHAKRRLRRSFPLKEKGPNKQSLARNLLGFACLNARVELELGGACLRAYNYTQESPDFSRVLRAAGALFVINLRWGWAEHQMFYRGTQPKSEMKDVLVLFWSSRHRDGRVDYFRSWEGDDRASRSGRII